MELYPVLKQGLWREELWKCISLNFYWDVSRGSLLNKMEQEIVGEPAMLIVATRDSLWRKGRPQESWLHSFCKLFPKTFLYKSCW